MDSKISNMQSEIVNLRQELIVDSFCVLEEELEAKIIELLDRRLGQLESHLDQLSGKVTAVYGTYCQPSVGSELNRVHNKKRAKQDRFQLLFHQLFLSPKLIAHVKTIIISIL